MKRIASMLGSLRQHLTDVRGVSLYEITAAVAMTGILAAVAVPVVLDRVSEAKATRAVQETDAISRAMASFQRDTGKWPGQAENTTLLVSSLSHPLPDGAVGAVAASGVSISNDLCAGPGVNAVVDDGSAASGACGDFNRYLVTRPLGQAYQNWRGPYLDEVRTDPFDRVYLVNVRPLYRAEGSGCNTSGYGWVLSGGPDRALGTRLTDTRLDPVSDDIGRNNGKRVAPGLGPCLGLGTQE